MSAGYTPGVPRLGVPALRSSDASMGIQPRLPAGGLNSNETSRNWLGAIINPAAHLHVAELQRWPSHA